MRLMLVDDSALFREGLAELLSRAGHRVVMQCDSVDGLMKSISTAAPDVVILDIRMPPTWTTEGIDAAIAMRQVGHDVGVLLLSQFVEATHAERLLRDGAAGIGYLLKDRVTDIAQIGSALQTIAAGGTVIDPEVVATLLAHENRLGGLEQLTPRERDVLSLIAEGRSNSAISSELYLSRRTVEGHVASIFAKLGLPDEQTDNRRVLAVLAYLRA